jgi:hypothetical protein
MTFNLNLLNKNKFKILIFVVCCVLVLVLIRQLVKAKKKEPFYQVVADQGLYTRDVEIQPELDVVNLQRKLADANTCQFPTSNNVALSCQGGTHDVFIHKGITVIKEGLVKDKINIESVFFEPGGTDPLFIGDNAFDGTSIKSVHIPARVTDIGTNAFTNLDNITFENGSSLTADSIDNLDTGNSNFTVSTILDEEFLKGAPDNIYGITFTHINKSSILVKYPETTETTTYFSEVCGDDQNPGWNVV